LRYSEVLEITDYRVFLACAMNQIGSGLENSAGHQLSLDSSSGDEKGFCYPGGRSVWPFGRCKSLLFHNPADPGICSAPYCLD